MSLERFCYLSTEDPFILHGLVRSLVFIKAHVKHAETIIPASKKRPYKRYEVYFRGFAFGKKYSSFGKMGLKSAEFEVTDKAPKGRLYKWLDFNHLVTHT